MIAGFERSLDVMKEVRSSELAEADAACRYIERQARDMGKAACGW